MLVGGPVAGGEPGPGDGLLAAEGEGPQLLLVKHRVPDTWAQWSHRIFECPRFDLDIYIYPDIST